VRSSGVHRSTFVRIISTVDAFEQPDAAEFTAIE
jgi:hypothetical protein